MGKFAASGLDSTGGAELVPVSNAGTHNKREPTEWHPTPSGVARNFFLAQVAEEEHGTVAQGVQQVQKVQ